jgi:two-component system, OmpR family, sensor kinase
MTWSIRARLTAWYSLVVVMVLAAGVAAVAIVQERLALERLDGELQRLMLTLEGVMRTEFSEGLDLQAAADEASVEVVAPDRTLLLTRPDGTVLANWGQPLASQWSPRTSDASTPVTIGVESTRRRVFSRSVLHGGHQYFAAVMAPLDGIESEHSELLASLAMGVVVALGVAVLGGWVVGRQTLRPLTDMALQATSITERDPSARLQAANSDDEVGQFAAAFNGLLDRLAAVLHAQRQFMADASHELRTPVSVVRTTAQVMLARETRSEDDYRESLTIVAEQSARLARLVDAMFLLSRAEAQGIPLRREPLYFDDLVAECARALRLFASERAVDVQTCGDAAVALIGDDGLLRQMVANLLENAVRHAKSGGRVEAAVRRTPTGVTLRITDDGTGVPPHERERIFQRFVRLDSRSGGAGLGLPIARWIAEAHGGWLVLDSSGGTGSVTARTDAKSTNSSKKIPHSAKPAMVSRRVCDSALAADSPSSSAWYSGGNETPPSAVLMSLATAPRSRPRTLHVTSMRRDPPSRVISFGVGASSMSAADSSGTMPPPEVWMPIDRTAERLSRASGWPQTTTSKSFWSS